MSKEAMKLALEAAYLAGFNASGEGYNGEFPFEDKNKNPEHDSVWCKDRDNDLEEALAKQEQGEPVAIVCNKGPKFHHVAILTDSGKQLEDGAKLYTTPQQRKPLTDEQMWNLWNSQGSDDMTQKEAIAFARAIEADHGIKE